MDKIKKSQYGKEFSIYNLELYFSKQINFEAFLYLLYFTVEFPFNEKKNTWRPNYNFTMSVNVCL